MFRQCDGRGGDHGSRASGENDAVEEQDNEGNFALPCRPELDALTQIIVSGRRSLTSGSFGSSDGCGTSTISCFYKGINILHSAGITIAYLPLPMLEVRMLILMLHVCLRDINQILRPRRLHVRLWLDDSERHCAFVVVDLATTPFAISRLDKMSTNGSATLSVPLPV